MPDADWSLVRDMAWRKHFEAKMRGDLTRAVIQTVIDAGPEGISSRGVVTICREFNILGTPEAIRSILSRARYTGALTYDGVYRAK